MNIPEIKRVHYRNPVTTIIWADGTQTQSMCDEHDNFNELTGFMVCVFKKIMKHKDMRKMFETFVYGNNKRYVRRHTDNKKQVINLDWLNDLLCYEPVQNYYYSPTTTYSVKDLDEEDILNTLNELFSIF